MERNKSIVVLDVGTYKTVLAVGEIKEGELYITGVGETLTRGIEKGLVVRSFDAIQSIKEAIDKAESIIGYKIDSVIANASGYHIVCANEKEEEIFPEGARTIQDEDIDGLLNKLADSIETNGYEILHIIPKKYKLDGYNEVEEPVGLTASKLEGEFHLILIRENDYKNLKRVITEAGVKPIDFVANPVASSEAVLYEDEKDLGVAVVDIGAGTTDIAVYIDKGLDYSASIPIAGNQITMDIAHRFKISKEEAEAIKVDYGTAMLEYADNSIIEVIPIGVDEPIQINNVELVETIEARLTEIFELVKARLDKKGYTKKLKGGIVLTGGVANTPDIKTLAEGVFKTDVRIGKPKDFKGYNDKLYKPEYATTIGIMLYHKANLIDNSIGLFSIFMDKDIDIMAFIKKFIDKLKGSF